MPMLKRTLEVVGRSGDLPTWEEASFVCDEVVATPPRTIPPDDERVGPRAATCRPCRLGQTSQVSYDAPALEAGASTRSPDDYRRTTLPREMNEARSQLDKRLTCSFS